MGCGACLVQAPPGMFVLDAQGKAVVTRPEQDWSPIDGEFIRHCPTYAISARPAAAPKAADAAGLRQRERDSGATGRLRPENLSAPAAARRANNLPPPWEQRKAP